MYTRARQASFARASLGSFNQQLKSSRGARRPSFSSCAWLTGDMPGPDSADASCACPFKSTAGVQSLGTGFGGGLDCRAALVSAGLGLRVREAVGAVLLDRVRSVSPTPGSPSSPPPPSRRPSKPRLWRAGPSWLLRASEGTFCAPQPGVSDSLRCCPRRGRLISLPPLGDREPVGERSVRARRSGALESAYLKAAPGPARAGGEAAFMCDARLVLPALGLSIMAAEHNFASRPLSSAGDTFESEEKQSPKSKGSKLSPSIGQLLCTAAGCCHFARVLPALPSSGVLSAFCICTADSVDESSATSPYSYSAVVVSASGEELCLKAALPPASASALFKFPYCKT